MQLRNVDMKNRLLWHDFNWHIQVGEAPIAFLYEVPALLLNLNMYMTYVGQVVSFFNCTELTLSEFLVT